MDRSLARRSYCFTEESDRSCPEQCFAMTALGQTMPIDSACRRSAFASYRLEAAIPLPAILGPRAMFDLSPSTKADAVPPLLAWAICGHSVAGRDAAWQWRIAKLRTTGMRQFRVSALGAGMVSRQPVAVHRKIARDCARAVILVSVEAAP